MMANVLLPRCRREVLHSSWFQESHCVYKLIEVPFPIARGHLGLKIGLHLVDHDRERLEYARAVAPHEIVEGELMICGGERKLFLWQPHRR